MVTLTNRVHGLRVRDRSLRHVRHFMEVAMLVMPFAVFFGLLTQYWEMTNRLVPEFEMTPSWIEWNFSWPRVVITFFGLTGFLGLLWSSFRFHFLGVPPQQVLHHATTIDVAERLGRRLIAPGPYHWMTKFPWNEIETVEVTEKHFHLRRLPREWTGLSIVHLSDVHFIGTLRREYFEFVCRLANELQPDMFVFTGDLLDDEELVSWLPTTFGKLKAPLGCWYVLGNHDWNLDIPPIREAMNRTGWVDVSGGVQSITYGEKELLIGGDERPWMGEHPDFTTFDPDAFRLLLSHTPDNLRRARRQNVDLMLSGHVHGGQVRLPIVGPVYAPSLHGVRYAGGVYNASPTLLHVSRGLAGRYPLRWHCRPELTKLVLHAEGE